MLHSSFMACFYVDSWHVIPILGPQIQAVTIRKEVGKGVVGWRGVWILLYKVPY